MPLLVMEILHLCYVKLITNVAINELKQTICDQKSVKMIYFHDVVTNQHVLHILIHNYISLTLYEV